jgi:diacylglycerol kinase family enzyme
MHADAIMIPAIVNRAAPRAEEGIATLREAGDFDIHVVDPADVELQVRAAIARGASRVLVAGGDGSLAAAARAIAGTPIALAVFPCGTLNHLARDAGVPGDLQDAARVASSPAIRSVDVGYVNDRLFLNTSSVGAYSTFVQLRDRLERRLGYTIASGVAGARLLWHLPLFRVTLNVAGRDAQYLTPLVFIGVGERELKLPLLGARVPGGQSGLHVMVIRRRSGARTLALAMAAAARGVDAVSRTPALDSFVVDSLRVERRHRSVAVDGEIVHCAPPLAYRCVRAALRVVVPERTR